MPATEKPFDRAALEQLCTKRFFFAPAFAIYGGKVVFLHLISRMKYSVQKKKEQRELIVYI